MFSISDHLQLRKNSSSVTFVQYFTKNSACKAGKYDDSSILTRKRRKILKVVEKTKREEEKMKKESLIVIRVVMKNEHRKISD